MNCLRLEKISNLKLTIDRCYILSIFNTMRSKDLIYIQQIVLKGGDKQNGQSNKTRTN
jgi:hypothetical protein